MNNTIEAIAALDAVQAAKKHLETNVTPLIDLIVAVQQVPAPTFAEAVRADFIQAKMTEMGLVDVAQDEIFNVYGRYPTAAASPQSPIIVSAHSDTVFPQETDLTVQRDGRYVFGPGIGDNSAGVAGILYLADMLRRFDFAFDRDIWFVSNVGEEGLGNLRGMRAVVARFGQAATYLVVEGGLYGQISHQAIGVKRYRIDITAAGGHSWGSFGKTSAIHELAHLIAAIDRLQIPATPKTTYNVGIIEGGTSINTIAQSASMLLDLRSESPEALETVVQKVQRLVAEANKRYKRHNIEKSQVTMTQIGNRPAGAIERSSPLVQAAVRALQQVGFQQPIFIASSTDANIPLSQNIPAVCIGLTKSNNAHRLDEYIEPRYLPQGMLQLLLLLLAAAGYEA